MPTEKTLISIRLPESQLDRLDKLTKDANNRAKDAPFLFHLPLFTRSDLIRSVIEIGLDHSADIDTSNNVGN